MSRLQACCKVKVLMRKRKKQCQVEREKREKKRTKVSGYVGVGEKEASRLVSSAEISGLSCMQT